MEYPKKQVKRPFFGEHTKDDYLWELLALPPEFSPMSYG
jgi:hypothetical protein